MGKQTRAFMAPRGGKRGAKEGSSKKGGAASGTSKKGGKKSQGPGASTGSRSAASNRKAARWEVKEANKNGRGTRRKRHHGGGEAIWETKQRLRVKVLQRQLQRLGEGAAVSAERRKLMVELGLLTADAGRAKLAMEQLAAALELDPEDADFAVRAPLLCLYMEEAKTEEAVELVIGPLFKPLMPAAPAKKTSKASAKAPKAAAVAKAPAGDAGAAAGGGESRFAAAVGLYSRAVLKYIKVAVLGEHRTDPGNAAAEEVELVRFLCEARAQNPFIAEFLAFAPAFEKHFPSDAELPPIEDTPLEAVERPLREALEYICRHRQLAVWMDTDEDIRKFVREQLFDEEDEEPGAEEEPPMRPLPAAAAGDGQILLRWRKAREEAMELWAEDLQAEAEEDAKGEGEGGEEEEGEGDEEEDGEDEESESEDASEALAGSEKRRGFG